MASYKLFISGLNGGLPSEAEQKIIGNVVFRTFGPDSIAIGTLNGLPIPFTTAFEGTFGGKTTTQITESGTITLESNPSFSATLQALVDEVISKLTNAISQIYDIDLGNRLSSELITEEPKQEEPQTDTQSTPEPSNKQTSAIVDPKSINSKITLSVKSGPGVIIGLTEKEVVNGEVDFSGIQFDKPGDYVISVTPTSPDLDNTEFSITIAPEEDIIPQDDSKGEEEKEVMGDRPIIAQISKPEIVLPPIKYDITSNDQDNAEIGFGLGFTPFFWYNALQIPERDIRSLELYHEGISPMVSITFRDTLGVMKGDGSPLDDTKFEVFLSSGSENLKSIHLKFKLKNFQRNPKSYTIVGSIDLPDFYNISYKSYTGTSFDVFKKISKELKTGFNSNIKSTTDSMKWTNTGMLFKDFVSNIIKHSYISDNAFMLGYIDHYWCFNYVDIEKEWTRDISNDVGVDSQGMSQMTESKSDGDKIVPLVLTNEPSQRSSSLYFEKHKISNNSTHQSLTKGQFTTIKYYDINKKSMMIFNVDSLTTNKDEVISLKGAPGDKKSFEENYRTKYLGRVDMDNVHENYIYSETQNRVNLDNLVKITADLELPQANYNLYKYQKIKVNFTNMKRTETSKSYLDERMSGEWLIIDIRYTWKSGKLSQKVKIARKELNKLPEELDAATEPKEGVDNSEINENPVDEKNPANIVYNVGETYKLKDKNGETYEIVIEKLSDDGNEVVAKLTHKPYNRLEGLSSTKTEALPSGTQSESESLIPEPDPTISYKLYIKEPSENEQKVVGDVVFRTSGPNKIAIGTLTGFPTFTSEDTEKYGELTGMEIASSGIITLESNPSFSASEEVLINDVISKLTNAIKQIYDTDLGNRLTFEKITT